MHVVSPSSRTSASTTTVLTRGVGGSPSVRRDFPSSVGDGCLQRYSKRRPESARELSTVVVLGKHPKVEDACASVEACTAAGEGGPRPFLRNVYGAPPQPVVYCLLIIGRYARSYLPYSSFSQGSPPLGAAEAISLFQGQLVADAARRCYNRGSMVHPHGEPVEKAVVTWAATRSLFQTSEPRSSQGDGNCFLVRFLPVVYVVVGARTRPGRPAGSPLPHRIMKEAPRAAPTSRGSARSEAYR